MWLAGVSAFSFFQYRDKLVKMGHLEEVMKVLVLLTRFVLLNFPRCGCLAGLYGLVTSLPVTF